MSIVFPKDTVVMIGQALAKFGITNKILQAGAITVATTEGGFQPKVEMSYSKTPNDRLRMLFGATLARIDEDSLTKAKSNDTVFFDIIYGGKYGNQAIGDGWKYRGRGFNQITFRDIYHNVGVQIGLDLVTNPDKLSQADIAAQALAAYFKTGFANIDVQHLINKRFGIDRCEDVVDPEMAAEICLQINAGWKTSLANARLAEELQQEKVNVHQVLQILNS